MKDYSNWEPSARLDWWVGHLRVIVWCCVIGYVLLVGSFAINFGYPENSDNHDKLSSWLIMSVLMCVFCFGRMGGWSTDDKYKKKEPKPSDYYSGVIGFLLLVVLVVSALYGAFYVTLPSIILICFVVAIGMFIGYKYSIPFYNYYRKYARVYIPKNMYWGKSQWQIDRMEKSYALLQAWYPLRIIAVFSWIIMGWLIIPFINTSPH